MTADNRPASAWIEERIGGTIVRRPAGLPDGLIVAFSGRAAAPRETASPTEVLARELARALGLSDLPLVRGTQVHGSSVVTVDSSPPPGGVREAGECDGLITTRAGVGLVVQTADCAPIVLAGGDAVGVAHAGWRGAARNVAGETVRALVRAGTPASELSAWIGPTIGACCYEVGPEVAERFDSSFARATSRGRFHLDLPSINRAQLARAGMSPERISIHPTCTFCGGETFASYRRDGAASGRMIALIARLAPTVT